MHNLHLINYNDFSTEELCKYLEYRYYPQVLLDMESIQKYIDDLRYDEDTELISVMDLVFNQLHSEVKQLITKDKILLFPHLINRIETPINLKPFIKIHQKINTVLMQLRKLLNNYIQQPEWSNQFKICFYELFSLEQSIQQVLYIKENFLWTKVNAIVSYEY